MKIRFLFFALLFSFLTVNTTHATPFLYTFKGNVQYFEINKAPNLTIPEDTGFLRFDSYSIAGVSAEKSNPITYSFVVDLGREGFCSPAGADQCDYEDGIPRDETGSDYFYAALDDASIEIPIDSEGTNFNFGLMLSTGFGEVETTLLGGSSIIIQTWDFSSSTDIALWPLFDTPSPGIPLVSSLIGMDKWDDGVNIGTMVSFFNLMTVEPIAVPEPSTWLMMLFGCLLYFCRRSEKYKPVPS